MERMPRDPENGVEISKEVFDGLKFIRQSGMTNMLDRPTVLLMAREWEFNVTIDRMLPIYPNLDETLSIAKVKTP